MNTIDPLIKSSTSRITGPIMTNQRDPRCRDFEMRYMECLIAYGKLKGLEKCSDYFDDWLECGACQKQVMRAYMMKFERIKQMYQGKRSRTKLYDNPADPSFFEQPE